jgi:hypothetical protein
MKLNNMQIRSVTDEIHSTLLKQYNETKKAEKEEILRRAQVVRLIKKAKVLSEELYNAVGRGGEQEYDVSYVRNFAKNTEEFLLNNLRSNTIKGPSWDAIHRAVILGTIEAEDLTDLIDSIIEKFSN